jgi:hypothetical protein
MDSSADKQVQLARLGLRSNNSVPQGPERRPTPKIHAPSERLQVQRQNLLLIAKQWGPPHAQDSNNDKAAEIPPVSSGERFGKCKNCFMKMRVLQIMNHFTGCLEK